PGYTISDAAIILAAVDPCYCCTERSVAFSKEGEKIFKGDELIKLCQQKTFKLKESYDNK
ncbi:MAG: hypothetical protein NC904_01905, partial [Candidatus Omnitrophica bacterium]|nr:hypothetical protein [Candidatus Omnitrophota bacterium]